MNNSKCQRRIIFAAEEDLPRLYQSGLTDRLIGLTRRNIIVKFLTATSPRAGTSSKR